MQTTLQQFSDNNILNQDELIFIDLKVAIQAISQHNPKPIMVNETRKFIYILSSRGNLITAQWLLCSWWS